MFTWRNTRRLSILGGVALTALLLAGCGTTQSGQAAGSSAVDDKPATGELNIWAQAAEAEALPKFAAEFEKLNPGLKINVTPLPWDAAYSKYQTAIASGTTPDMAQMGTTWMPNFADSFAPVPTGVSTSGFFDGALKVVQVKGKTLAVPWTADLRAFFYRKDLAKKAGYTEFPKTWAEFKTFAKALQTKAGAKWGVFLTVKSLQDMLVFPYSAGAHLTNAAQTKWTLDSPEMVKALTYYKSFFTDGIANPNPDGAVSSEAAFVDGSIPVLIGGGQEISTIAAAGGGASYKDKIGVGLVPADTSSTSFLGGSDLAVFKNSKNPDAAWKFIRWLSTPAVQVKWQQAVGDLPTVKAAWDDPTLKDDPLLKVFGEQLKSTDSPPSLTSWTEVSAAGDKAIEQLVRGGESPAAVAKSLQSQAESIGAK
ncbi:carbohydrate ABC transporter substrate-binding protein, CUT1 family [Leifsonia sp. CL147]|nr:carbohydrate ABC transporter substrate-binding protein, CUT1 family [Leifsonia sp. CL154]SFL22152.1 carbohydrate ABC transporter substrate-binding protein, CUT1 family [Leifsonia sp. CL147]